MGADELLAAALRGEAAPWPVDAGAGFDLALLHTAREHGVASLLTTTEALRVVGPMAPATKRCVPVAALTSSATVRANRAASRLISLTSASMW